jgi:hypothetical protein
MAQLDFHAGEVRNSGLKHHNVINQSLSLLMPTLERYKHMAINQSLSQLMSSL